MTQFVVLLFRLVWGVVCWLFESFVGERVCWLGDWLGLRYLVVCGCVLCLIWLLGIELVGVKA